METQHSVKKKKQPSKTQKDLWTLAEGLRWELWQSRNLGTIQWVPELEWPLLEFRVIGTLLDQEILPHLGACLCVIHFRKVSEAMETLGLFPLLRHSKCLARADAAQMGCSWHWERSLACKRETMWWCPVWWSAFPLQFCLASAHTLRCVTCSVGSRRISAFQVQHSFNILGHVFCGRHFVQLPDLQGCLLGSLWAPMSCCPFTVKAFITLLLNCLLICLCSSSDLNLVTAEAWNWQWINSC